MSQLVKFSAAAGLVLAGFFAASLLGPPEHLASRLHRADESTTGRLVPIDEPSATSLAPPTSSLSVSDNGVTPAGFTSPPQPQITSSVRAAHYPETSSPEGAWGAPRATSGSHGPAFPEIRRAEGNSPPWGNNPSEATLSTLGPPPELADFDRQRNAASSFPSESPTGTLGAPSPTPPPTFAQQPTRENSAWADRDHPAQPTAPLPWSTAANATPPERAQTSLHTPLTEATPNWEEARPASAIRWHVVADGDSLPRLAQRYLGDAGRGLEIFEENRNVLKNPDVLPIGVQLRIPTPATLQVYDSQGEPHSGIHPRRLVSLPEVSPAAIAAPVARLRPPQSPGSSN